MDWFEAIAEGTDFLGTILDAVQNWGWKKTLIILFLITVVVLVIIYFL